MGQTRFLGKRMCRVGGHTLGETVCDARKEQDAEGIVVATRHVLRVLREGILIDTLIGITYLCAHKANYPRDVEPNHEHRQGGKRTVDGIVAGEYNLEVDVQVLQKLEERTNDDAGDEHRMPVYMGVWHQFVEQDKANAPEQHGGYLDDELHGGGENHVFAEYARQGYHEDGKTAGDDNHQGQDDKDGDVVDDAPIDVARSAHVPNGVECRLDAAGQHDHRVEQHDEAEAEEYATVGVFEVGVDETEYRVGQFVADGEVVAQLLFDDRTEVKASCHGEDDGQDRHGGQNAAIGQRCGIAGEIVVEKTIDSDGYAAQEPYPEATAATESFGVDTPNVACEESLYVLYFHGRMFYMPKGTEEKVCL